jgi:hypothetical protein
MGPFLKSAVTDSVKSGAFSLSDLACQEGMNQWLPLQSLMDDLPHVHPSAPTFQPLTTRSRSGAPLLMAIVGFVLLGGAGLVVGGFVGFLLRPAAPFIGQLPLETVLTRGANLSGLDVMLVGVAQTSFNYLVTGVILGGFSGAISGVFGGFCVGLLFSRR